MCWDGPMERFATVEEPVNGARFFFFVATGITGSTRCSGGRVRCAAKALLLWIEDRNSRRRSSAGRGRWIVIGSMVTGHGVYVRERLDGCRRKFFENDVKEEEEGDRLQDAVYVRLTQADSGANLCLVW